MNIDPRLVVPDTFTDINKMIGLSLADPAAVRGQGHTTHQMLTAPENAFFVCPTKHIGYYRDLAYALGRQDLQIQSPIWLREDHWLRVTRGKRSACIVIDHAYDELNRRWLSP